MKHFTQETIDKSVGCDILKDNPNGGSGLDYQNICEIIQDKNTGEPLYWKATPTASTLGVDMHKIGIEHPVGTDIETFVVDATSIDNYTFKLNSLSQIIGFGIVPLSPNMSMDFLLKEKFSNGEKNNNELKEKIYPLYADMNPYKELTFNVPQSNTLQQAYFRIPTKLYMDNMWIARGDTGTWVAGQKLLIYFVKKPWEGIITFEQRYDGSNYYQTRPFVHGRLDSIWLNASYLGSAAVGSYFSEFKLMGDGFAEINLLGTIPSGSRIGYGQSRIVFPSTVDEYSLNVSTHSYFRFKPISYDIGLTFTFKTCND